MEKWIETETTGSPFIIMDKINVEKYNPKNDLNDICSIKSYTGIIRKNNYNIFVFGDESFPLKMVNRNDEILIFRWVYAPNNDIVDKIINEVFFNDLEIIENIIIEWDTKNLVLFDSIKNFNETEEKIEINLYNKNCIIKTMVYENYDTMLLIHKILQNK